MLSAHQTRMEEKMNKEAAIRQLSTVTIRRILDTTKMDKVTGPLAGKVSIEGIGHVELKDLRAELARREELFR